ncbi:uncharacterized protein [Lolium perenne]|uniref:uncharacterized protein n=1 Tax=Lolium perenne TaxID=4522 RepID=UPI003A991FF3
MYNCWLGRRLIPLRCRAHPMWEYRGQNDRTRSTATEWDEGEYRKALAKITTATFTSFEDGLQPYTEDTPAPQRWQKIADHLPPLAGKEPPEMTEGEEEEVDEEEERTESDSEARDFIRLPRGSKRGAESSSQGAGRRGGDLPSGGQAAEEARKRAKAEVAELTKVLEQKGRELEDVITEYKVKLEAATDARDSARGAAASLREEVAALKQQHAKELAAEKEASEGIVLAVQAEKTNFEAFVREMSRQILGTCDFVETATPRECLSTATARIIACAGEILAALQYLSPREVIPRDTPSVFKAVSNIPAVVDWLRRSSCRVGITMARAWCGALLEGFDVEELLQAMSSLVCLSLTRLPGGEPCRRRNWKGDPGAEVHADLISRKVRGTVEQQCPVPDRSSWPRLRRTATCYRIDRDTSSTTPDMPYRRLLQQEGWAGHYGDDDSASGRSGKVRVGGAGQ